MVKLQWSKKHPRIVALATKPNSLWRMITRILNYSLSPHLFFSSPLFLYKGGIYTCCFLGFCMWCPSFGACVLILDGFCFFLCSRFPVLATSKFDSDSFSFICGESICFLTRTLSNHTIAYRGDAGRWLCPTFWTWTLVTIYFTDSRVCPSMPEHAPE